MENHWAENAQDTLQSKNYFVTDRITGGDFWVDYCPTEKMLADFFTKPLEGKMFRVFRSMIMNIQQTDFPQYFEYPIAYNSMTTADNGTVPGSTQEFVGKHTVFVLCNTNSFVLVVCWNIIIE